ncbi:MAG: ABC transporter transmembrane domain-containing protein, partial [Pseudomonadota bacterium]
MIHRWIGNSIGVPEFKVGANSLGLRSGSVWLILSLQILAVFFEGIGIGMFLPILQFIEREGDIASLTAESGLWRELVEFFASVGLEVSLPLLLGVAFGLFVIRQIFMFARLIITNNVRIGLIRQYRQSVFRLLLRANLDLHDQMKPGDFVNEVTLELTQAVGSLMSFISLVGLLIMVAVYVGWMSFLSLPMTIAAVGIFGLTALALAGLVKRSRKVGRDVVDANQAVGRFLVERFRMIRLIRLAAIYYIGPINSKFRFAEESELSR